MAHGVFDHEVLEAIDKLLPTLRERAQETEDLRRMPDETVADLQATGLFKLTQPTQWGGYAAEPVIIYDAIRRISSACGSTGWIAGVFGIHPWHLALFDQQAQHEVWGENREALICSSYAPMGAGLKVEGGFRVSGAWRYSSGCDHAQWALLGGPVLEDGGPIMVEGKPQFGSFLIPKSEFTIDRVWDTFGLAGSGSNTVLVQDVFVPEHRFLSFHDMNDGTMPGVRVNTEPVYRMPWGTILPTALSTPVLGMAEGARDIYVEYQRERWRAAFAGEQAKQDPYITERVGRVSSDIDASRRQLFGHIAEEYATLLAGDEVSIETRLDARRDQVRATQRNVAAIDVFMESAGAAALAKGTPLQRLFRDAHAARVHATHEAEKVYDMYGKYKFGLDPELIMV
ncbi:flavin-dependent monooxygenase [Nocardia sp. CDC153]|uniref:3-hydroxy-9,10-secoandrosta-1,3,5(10)-triene-9, 17-dione monooxygenase oxygenase subunit n=1 Tax=Nocardia sp. CDC153 TaxID=3112167 RepID=UPI002DBE091A|nr:3-hydroxy-9,10-secoandrosta-1,3,5(10)-triene-9,17-dione monooxygenase oxygenase subunit [Nocardia sp. CDC153]MEC3956357.1 flavin-dependent monooxygenase [Nocardia sp. CDC153]